MKIIATEEGGLQWNKLDLFGVAYSALTYSAAVSIIQRNAIERRSLGVSALAVHGLTIAVNDQNFLRKLKDIDLIVPDGQPVRWMLNYVYNARLPERVYGPELTLRVLEMASEHGLRIYLYGSTRDTLRSLESNIERRFPGVVIVGSHPDRFREATVEEDAEDSRKIADSGAHIVFVGRGCPRQEIWVANHVGKLQAVLMAVGAAFDFIAGKKPQAPRWMQDVGLEWFFRLMVEPRRLWKRYLISNSQFLYLVLKHILNSGKHKA